MAGGMKRLAKETAVYGLSSMGSPVAGAPNLRYGNRVLPVYQ